MARRCGAEGTDWEAAREAAWLAEKSTRRLHGCEVLELAVRETKFAGMWRGHVGAYFARLSADAKLVTTKSGLPALPEAATPLDQSE